MIEQVEEQICIKFCVQLEHSTEDTIGMIQTVTAMGNWWWQLHHNNMPVHQITQVTPPYSPDVVPCDFWLFPKLKSPLKGKRFQTVDEIQENIWWGGSWQFQKRILQSILNSGRDTGRTVWGSKVPALKGTEVSLSCVQCFFYLGSSSINISIFHITWLDTFWTDLINVRR